MSKQRLYRGILEPLLALLRQGVSPDRLALCVASESPLTNRRNDHLWRFASAAHGVGGTGARVEIAIETDVNLAKSR